MTEIEKSAAVQHGADDAAKDLRNCMLAADVVWYRDVAYSNLANGTELERAYFLGYDHAMAMSA